MNKQNNRTEKQKRFHQQYGTWAVVTGASDGIGKEIAVRLAESGFNLILVARRKPLLETIATQLEQTSGIKTRVIAAHLDTRQGIQEVIQQSAELDVGLLVAAAGFGTTGEFLKNSLESEASMLEVNCYAAMALTHTLGNRFVQRKRGGIILFSSIVAFQGVPKSANYAATKGYIQTLVEGLRPEFKPYGVDILACAPGPVQTGFATRANMRMGQALSAKDIAQTTLDTLGKSTTVRPGWLSVLLESLLTPLPRWARTLILTQIMAGMTKHQTS